MIAFFLLALKGAAFIEQRQMAYSVKSKDGQAVALQDFARARGFVRYRISRSDQFNFLGPIAKRFQVSGWQKIAEATLQGLGKKSGPEEIGKFQYQVPLGSEIRIPLLEISTPLP